MIDRIKRSMDERPPRRFSTRHCLHELHVHGLIAACLSHAAIVEGEGQRSISETATM
jgi:hypothetical protein